MVVPYWAVFRQPHKPTTMILRCVQQSNRLSNSNRNWTHLENNWWKWKRLNLVSIYFMRGKRFFSMCWSLFSILLLGRQLKTYHTFFFVPPSRLFFSTILSFRLVVSNISYITFQSIEFSTDIFWVPIVVIFSSFFHFVALFVFSR